MKKIIYYIVLILFPVITGCSKGEVDFTYSPSEPRCGQSVSFNNTSTKGDSDSKWEWVFGDGTTSTLKSPSKIYKDAGVYMVTLTLDEKKHQQVAKQITIYDTIPTFTANLDSFGTYQKVTFTALTYNPYNKTLDYTWILPEDAVVTDSVNAAVRTMYFKEASDAKEITLITNLGGVKTTKTITYQIPSTPAASIIMTTESGELWRQRIYTDIVAVPEPITPAGVDLINAGQLLVDNNTLYIFCLEQGSAGAIYAMDLETGKISTVIQNASTVTEYIYSTGMINDGYLYFTNIYNKNIYRINTAVRDAVFTDGTEQLWADENSLTNMKTGECGGIGVYGDLYYLSSTEGIYRFKESDINASTVSAPLISAEQAPLNLLIDRLAGKIYTIEGNTLMIRNINGEYAVRLVEGIDSQWAISLNNSINRIIYAADGIVAALPLVQTRNNMTTASPVILNQLRVKGLVIDQTER